MLTLRFSNSGTLNIGGTTTIGSQSDIYFEYYTTGTTQIEAGATLDFYGRFLADTAPLGTAPNGTLNVGTAAAAGYLNLFGAVNLGRQNINYGEITVTGTTTLTADTLFNTTFVINGTLWVNDTVDVSNTTTALGTVTLNGGTFNVDGFVAGVFQVGTASAGATLVIEGTVSAGTELSTWPTPTRRLSVAAPGGGVFVNGLTIDGQGQIGSDGYGAQPLTFVNNGTIDADTGTLTIDRSVVLSSAGTLKAENGGTLTLEAALTSNSGTLEAVTGGILNVELSFANSGLVLANGGTVNLESGLTSNSGGTLEAEMAAR